MNILDLVNKDKSGIQYEISNFPDGQQQLKLLTYPGINEVLIKSRLNNFMDLELIVCAVKSLNQIEVGVNNISLFVPYFLGSRSDRKFIKGENNYLKDVICPIINSLNLTSVIALNPHSDVLEACLNNFCKEYGNEFNKWALTQINNKNDAQERIVFMSPDAGALKKIYETAKYVNFTGDIINCSKIRDVGKVIKTEVPHFDITKDVVIFDDICDGGKTFIEIAKVIKHRHESYEREKSNIPIGKIYLVVTHGIFSKGIDELVKYFDAIYCTNSYKDKHYFNPDNFINQFNIF